MPIESETLPRANRDPAHLEADLAEHGYCLIEGALEGYCLKAVRDRLFAQAAAERKLHSAKNPANLDPVNQWVGMLLNKGEVFFQLVEHPLYCRLVEGVIGDRYIWSTVDAQIQHPGAGAMPLHSDQWWMPQPVAPEAPNPRVSEITRGVGDALDPAPAHHAIAPAMAVNAMWMVSDFTAANGATRIVPGSHRAGCQPDKSVPHRVETLVLEGPAGSACVFDARLWHGAGANLSGEARYGITTVSAAPQTRPLENYTRGLRPEVFARLTPARARRLGFTPLVQLRPHW